MNIPTGYSENSCKCSNCKAMCKVSPCFPTPEDFLKYEKMGMAQFFRATAWADIRDFKIYPLIAPIGIETGQNMGFPLMRCIFNIQDLCALHDANLKPTEGKLANHDSIGDDLRKAVCETWDSDLGRELLKKYITKNFEDELRHITDKIGTLKTLDFGKV